MGHRIIQVHSDKVFELRKKKSFRTYTEVDLIRTGIVGAYNGNVYVINNNLGIDEEKILYEVQ
jgi:hypothetical protein